MRFVIGVDPGKDKVGLAVVEIGGRLVERRLLTRAAAAGVIAGMVSETGATVALGNGTTASDLAAEIALAMDPGKAFDLAMVDERDSTVEGRRNYLLANRPRGLARLLPLGLRSPDKPWDDYVAEVIARRYLNSPRNRDEMQEK